MRFAVIGAAGQLGSELCEQLGANAVGWTRSQIDLLSRDAIEQALREHAPDIVINAAAYNKVDLAEDEPEKAYETNALGPRLLAQLCAQHNMTLVHVSTDYVFGADICRSTPYVESDAPGPVSAYGISKLSGEYYVRSLCPRHFVIRTCGLYGHAARQGAGKGNFVETMIRLGQQRDVLRVVDDQVCTPTSVRHLARALIQLATTNAYGLYHATNSGTATWARLAEAIFEFLQMPTRVERISSADYPTKALRPGYSVLNCHKLANAVGSALPDWQTAVREYLEERRQ